MQKKSQICAVVVTHHPESELLKQLLEASLPQVSALVVVDNGSDEQEISLIRNWQLLGQIGNFSLIELGENLGIATAQNRGVAWSREHACSHVLFLDQDSIPAADMVQVLQDALSDLVARGIPVGAVGPRLVDRLTERSVSNRLGGTGKLCTDSLAGLKQADFLVSSGMLIVIPLFEHVGLLEEGLFIDTVDTEWCFRACVNGYKLFEVPHAILYHSLGDKTHNVWVGRHRRIPQHKPFRYYYLYRNSVLLCKRTYIPRQWKIKNMGRLIFLLMFGIIVMPERKKRLLMAMRGIRDGISGKSGKLK